MESKNINLLLVEDNDEILDIIELYLPKHYTLIKARDGSEAIKIFDENNIDIMVLDLMLPKISGYDVLNYVRAKSEVPVIIISAKNLEHEIIIGLNKGADDYLTKPFSPMELVARLDVLVRRFCNKSKEKESILIGDLRLDLSACELFIKDKKVELTGKEFKLLKLFMENAGRVITKNQLMDSLWGDDCFDDNAVAVYISRLRDKIESDSKKPEYILTTRGLGYKFNEKK